jgi:hypothetical protein
MNARTVMGADEVGRLLNDLRRRGVTISRDGDRLLLSLPADLELTAAELETLKAVKPIALELLAPPVCVVRNPDRLPLCKNKECSAYMSTKRPMRPNRAGTGFLCQEVGCWYAEITGGPHARA